MSDMVGARITQRRRARRGKCQGVELVAGGESSGTPLTIRVRDDVWRGAQEPVLRRLEIEREQRFEAWVEAKIPLTFPARAAACRELTGITGRCPTFPRRARICPRQVPVHQQP